MKARCLNRRNKGYKRYGGRGITVCERWMKFENFIADMGKPPIGLTLERKNNNGNYEPNNCKWATRAEQAKNKENATPMLSLNGQSMCLVDCEKRLGFKRGSLRDRLKRGWSVEKALYTPIRANHKLTKAQVFEIRQSALSTAEVAAVFRVNKSHIHRIRNNIQWKHV